MKPLAVVVFLACSLSPSVASAAGPVEGTSTEAELTDRQGIPRRFRPLGRLGKAGLGVLVIGAGTTMTGGILLGVGETRPADNKSRYRDLRPAGFAVVGVGTSLLLAGATLLIADRVLAGRPRRMSWAPSLSPTHAGLRVGARF